MTADLSALLDRLEAAAAWRDVKPVDDEQRRARYEAGKQLIESVPVLIAELRAHQAAVQAVRELAAAWLRDGSAPAQAIEVREIVGRSRLRAAVAALDPKETS